MTRWLLISVLLMLVFSLGTQFVLQDPGYVMIALGSKTLHMRFWPAVMLFSLSALLIFWLVVFGSRLIRLLRGRGWRQTSNTGNGRRQMAFWLHYFEGSWGRLLKESKRSLSKKPELIPSLMAAEAATYLGDLPQQQQLLAQAELAHPRHLLAIRYTAARLAAAGGNWQEVISHLQLLRQHTPEHKPSLALLSQAYSARGDWPELASISPDLKRLKVLAPDAQLALDEACYSGLLQAAADTGFEALQNAWQALPKAYRSQSRPLLTYGRALLQLERGELAEPLIRKRLQQSWSDELAELYGLLSGANPQEQLKQAEAWLSQQPRNACLLMALGRICWRLQYWGRARDYFDQAHSLAPNAQTFVALAEVYSRLGDKGKSQELYERGLTELAKASR